SASLGLVLLSAEQGVYVLAVSDQSPAALSGLEPGDYILSAQGEPLADIASLDERLQGSEELLLSVRRGDELLEIMLPGR
ncbi:MAG: PDZ domain-containing protein, partial [Clostridia bacterium]|nr:PDZ domain-containing protein [Clostridia bacterium]